MLEKKINDNSIKYLNFLLLSFPILLISGPFLTDTVVIVMSIFFVMNYRNFDFDKKLNSFLVLTIIFYILINISSLLSDNIYISLKSSLFYFRFIFFAFVIAILVQKIKEDINLLSWFVNIFYFIFIFLFIDSSLQFITGENLFGYKVLGHLKSERVSSIFGDKLILGSFISKTMFIFIGLLHAQESLNYKSNTDFKVFVIIQLSMVTILISGERSPFLLALFGTIIYYIINKKIKLILTLFLSISIFFGIIYLNQSSKDRYLSKYKILYENIFIDKQIGQSKHNLHFKTALNMFEDNKLFGHGIKSFRSKCNLIKYNEGNKSCSTHPHNYYIQLLSSSGIITFSILISFFIYLSFEIYKSFKNYYFNNKLSNEKNCYLISSFLSIFPFTTSGSFFNNWISATIFLSLGFLISHFKTITYK